MNIIWLLLTVALGLGLIYIFSARRYQSSDSVTLAYDQWTQDGILEFYWGEHIHLGHYGSPLMPKIFVLPR